MPKFSGFGGDGLWMRADEYVVEEGIVIPVGQPVSYDPWEDYDRWRKGDKDVEAPYVRLLNLLNELIFHPGKFENIYGDLISRRPRALERFEKSEMATAILDCCRHTGLLGVISRRITAFRSEDTGDIGEEPGVTYRWSPSGWCVSEKDEGKDLIAITDGVYVRGEVYSPWIDFFSDEGVEIVGYPPPLSPPFWACYQEPVVDFVIESVNLLKIIRGIFDIFSDEEHVTQATEDLNAFLISAKPIIARNNEGELVCRWVTPSLLDTYAVMIAMDIMYEPRRIAVCCNCGKLFVPTGKKILFCDDKCRNTGNKKLARKRQSTANEWAKNGMSVEQIAEKLKSDPEAVKRWISE